MVVRALDVDDLGETPLPFGQVVGHIGHEIGVVAVRLAHHAVFVITKVCGSQPQGAVLFIGVSRRLH